jgi:hypothetical protein
MIITLASRAEADARAWLQHITELVAANESAADTSEKQQRALEHILDAPLAVAVRSDWHPPGTSDEPAEYQLLLSWGGPASQIVGSLQRGRPVDARLEYQDWFTPWQPLALSREEARTLRSFAEQFQFGD